MANFFLFLKRIGVDELSVEMRQDVWGLAILWYDLVEQFKFQDVYEIGVDPLEVAVLFIYRTELSVIQEGKEKKFKQPTGVQDLRSTKSINNLYKSAFLRNTSTKNLKTILQCVKEFKASLDQVQGRSKLIKLIKDKLKKMPVPGKLKIENADETVNEVDSWLEKFQSNPK